MSQSINKSISQRCGD